MDVIAAEFKSVLAFFGRSIAGAAVVLAFTIVSVGQETTQTSEPPPLTPVPFVTELKGISLGMTRDDVVEKLGKPKMSDKSGMLFTPEKNEMIQIGIGPQGKVRTIALIYEDGDDDAPDVDHIFGPAVTATANEDGSIYKMVRYQKAGFWLAYSRSGDKNPMTTVTMRRIGN